ncbi:MAG: hypothetical protein PF481_11785 [Bacteroidales bacterium]|jgi:hypothetical protein|nr:hypothetical protein [Bacteroidales bacterium]
MKKILFIVLSAILISLTSCGPSAEELQDLRLKSMRQENRIAFGNKVDSLASIGEYIRAFNLIDQAFRSYRRVSSVSASVYQICIDSIMIEYLDSAMSMEKSKEWRSALSYVDQIRLLKQKSTRTFIDEDSVSTSVYQICINSIITEYLDSAMSIEKPKGALQFLTKYKWFYINIDSLNTIADSLYDVIAKDKKRKEKEEKDFLYENENDKVVQKIAVFNNVDRVKSILSKNGIGDFGLWMSDGYEIDNRYLWFSSTPYFVIGNTRDINSNNIAYYLYGKHENVVNKVDLILNINNPKTAENALYKFHEISAMTFKSLGLEEPYGVRIAIMNRKEFTEKNEYYSIYIKNVKTKINTWHFIIELNYENIWRN